MNTKKFLEIENNIHFIGIRLSVLKSLINIMIEVLINIEENTYIDAQNLSLVILKELKEIKYKFNQIEKFLNI